MKRTPVHTESIGRYLDGEATPKEQEEFEEWLRTDAERVGFEQRAFQVTRGILSSYTYDPPTEPVFSQVDEDALIASMHGEKRALWWWAMPALAACVLLMFPLSWRGLFVDKPLSYTAKGLRDARCQMFHALRRPHEGGAFAPVRTRDGEILAPGDLVQFSCKTSKTVQLMIVSLNQKGEVFPFVPFHGARSHKLAAGQSILPSRSLELDHYLGPERFFFILSDKPLVFRDVKRSLLRYWRAHRRSVRRLDQLPQPFIHTLLIEKKKKR